MEAGGSRLARQGLQQYNLPSTTIPALDVVRALHQTVISLRTALDSSKAELRRLRKIVGNFRGENYIETVAQLSLENHVLRRRILDDGKKENEDDNCNDTDELSVTRAKSKSTTPVFVISEHPAEVKTTSMEEEAIESTVVKEVVEKIGETSSIHSNMADVPVADSISTKDQGAVVGERASVSQDLLEIPEKDPEDVSLRSVSEGDNSVFSDYADSNNQRQLAAEDKEQEESENESDELDDIELIFTTDETCSRDVGLQEDLVSITENEIWQQAGSQPVLLKYTKGSSTEVPVCNGEKTGTSSVEEPLSSQSSSIDREESVDRFDEASSARLNKIWSQCSVLVETDISKCGVLEDLEQNMKYNAARRNTLAAPPTAYRPIIHRESHGARNRKGSGPPLRPIHDRSSGARRESGAQTTITALPFQWRSESYLAHKVPHTFTTLPSRFALPPEVTGKLKILDKGRSSESRRLMLSDINFTCMVPELSRSADHLFQESHAQSCVNARGGGQRTPDIHHQDSLGSPAGYYRRGSNVLGTTLASPCECRPSTEFFSTRNPGSLPSPIFEVASGPSRRHSWRSNAASFDTWKVPATTTTSRPTWSSVPSSPIHRHPPSHSTGKNGKYSSKRTRSKVTFQECPVIRGSLPNLRADFVSGDNSGDSTDSLIDEAEEYVRRSIDSVLNLNDGWTHQANSRQRKGRRHSETDLFSEWNPPKDARPYVPKKPQDLKLNHLVKVISPDARVLVGKIRYIGKVPALDDTFVGVELPDDSGSSDGTYRGRRFFICEPDQGIFVPFKKVVFSWYTT